MKLRTVLVNRLLTFAVGAALLGAGAFALAWVWQVRFAREWLARLDRPASSTSPTSPGGRGRCGPPWPWA